MSVELVLFLNKLGFEFVIEDGKVSQIVYTR